MKTPPYSEPFDRVAKSKEKQSIAELVSRFMEFSPIL
jgi:hypothetical protein